MSKGNLLPTIRPNCSGEKSGNAMVQYLIRLDDLCPTNNLKKWERFFKLFDRYGIKPIIAVIPNNRDAKLIKCGNYNPDYWNLVRGLQKKKYILGMHGFEHRYATAGSGLFKLNNRSEFAGLPLHVQEQKISVAQSIFKRERINAHVFVAPAHTFDLNTLRALKRCTGIRMISDGLLSKPYTRYGFNWVPVQLPEATLKEKDTWTFNYHPETCTDEAFRKLERFIAENHRKFVSLNQLTFSSYSFRDYLKEHYQVYKRVMRRFLKRLIASIKQYSSPRHWAGRRVA